MGSFRKSAPTDSLNISNVNSEFVFSQIPSLVQWMATLKCDLNCQHCLSVSPDDCFTDMPLKDVKKLIDEVADMGVEEFLVTGGEPLARKDLPEIVEHLGFREQSWTLNTAVLPSESQRKALLKNSPGFVAVSLDGPREIHDTIRGVSGAWQEVMEAIRFFKSLPGVRVCAGTTVTAINFRSLEETFHLVASSGADQWGIHLLVPEGRAASRSELFLSRRQLKKLISFVSRKREYFKVEMADEIGYLGSLEPLVRDFPMTCGAGRSQCVILPDGEVVPCTTLDRSFSAGNIHRNSLREIWETGFASLRNYSPGGKCSDCIYSPACGSGCWLQRKNGKECFREVWHIQDSLKTAAGITVCLGAIAAGLSSGAEADSACTSEIPSSQVYVNRDEDDIHIVDAGRLLPDAVIMDIYTEILTGYDPGRLYSSLDQIDEEDPAWEILNRFRNRMLPQSVKERCELVLRVNDTEYASLSLAALLWRVVNEPVFDNINLTGDELISVYETLDVIRATALEWRHTIFNNRLNPYIGNGRFSDQPFFMYSKAGPRPGEMEKHLLTLDLIEERWGSVEDSTAITAEYLLENPYADQMNLEFSVSSPVEICRYSGNELVPLHTNAEERYSIGIFDIIQSDRDAAIMFEIAYANGSEIPFGFETQSHDETEENKIVLVEVSIEGGRTYAYSELLLAAYHQQRDLLLETTLHSLLEYSLSDRFNTDILPGEIVCNETLLWPAVREIAVSSPESTSSAGESIHNAELRRRAMEKDIDFWMF